MSGLPNESTGRVANIDARGRRRRLVGGVVWLAIATAATAVLAALGEREPKGPMSDAEKRQARRQATGVWIRSIGTGVVVTLIVWLLLRR